MHPQTVVTAQLKCEKVLRCNNLIAHLNSNSRHAAFEVSAAVIKHHLLRKFLLYQLFAHKHLSVSVSSAADTPA